MKNWEKTGLSGEVFSTVDGMDKGRYGCFYGSKVMRYDGRGYEVLRNPSYYLSPDSGCRDLYGVSDRMTYHVLYVYLACVLK